jgi:hypothetical protein
MLSKSQVLVRLAGIGKLKKKIINLIGSHIVIREFDPYAHTLHATNIRHCSTNGILLKQCCFVSDDKWDCDYL